MRGDVGAMWMLVVGGESKSKDGMRVGLGLGLLFIKDGMKVL
jgi:hypothetical protein